MFLHDLFFRLRTLMRRPAAESELDDELRFHLERQTGGVSRDIERGAGGIRFLLNFMLFNIIPTILEIVFIAGILLVKYDAWFAIITFMPGVTPSATMAWVLRPCD